MVVSCLGENDSKHTLFFNNFIIADEFKVNCFMCI